MRYLYFIFCYHTVSKTSLQIRTPLSGLTGMLDLLTDTALNPEQHDYVDTMHHSAEGLLCIINDILGMI